LGGTRVSASAVVGNNGEGIVSPQRPRFVIGEPFNPWRGTCGFYPPGIVGRQRTLKDGPKRLYECLVRRAGHDGECFPAHVTIAEDLGKSVAQVKRDYRILVKNRLVRHRSRDRRRSNSYEFLWHPWFESSSLSRQRGAVKSTHPAAEGSRLSCRDGVGPPIEVSSARSQIDFSPTSELPREVRSENLKAHPRARNSVQEFSAPTSSSSSQANGKPLPNPLMTKTTRERPQVKRDPDPWWTSTDVFEALAVLQESARGLNLPP
jgi:hypothetical protein